VPNSVHLFTHRVVTLFGTAFSAVKALQKILFTTHSPIHLAVKGEWVDPNPFTRPFTALFIVPAVRNEVE